MLAEFKILILEDNIDDAAILRREIKKSKLPCTTNVVPSIHDFYVEIFNESYDLIISDFSINGGTVIDALTFLAEQKLPIPLIVISGQMSEKKLLPTIAAGATDCLVKGNFTRLPAIIERDIKKGRQNRHHLALHEQVRRGKMEWEAAFDSAPDMIILADVLDNVIRCNKRAADLLGMDYQSIIGKKISELFYPVPSDRGNVFSQLAEQTEVSDVTFPGIKGWYNIKVRPIAQRDDCSTSGRVYLIEETTKHKQILEDKRLSERELLCMQVVAFKLNSRENFFNVIQEILTHIHSILGIDFSAIHVLQDTDLVMQASLNTSKEFFKASCRIPHDSKWVNSLMAGETIKGSRLGLPMPADIKQAAADMGVEAWSAVPLVSDQDVIGSLWVAKRSRKKLTARELRLLRAISNQLAVLVENHQLFAEVTKKARLLEAKEQELQKNLEKVKRANEELKSLNKAKDMFIGMASHELKSPLAQISTTLQHVVKYDNKNLSSSQISMLNTSLHRSQQLSLIVDNLLSLSRLEMRDHKPEKTPFNILSAFREVGDVYQETLAKRKITISITGTEESVPIDSSMFGYVARNLIENAMKFTPDGGSIDVHGYHIKRDDCIELADSIRNFYPSFLKTTLPPEYYRIDVKDTGIGIPSDERIKVFDRFYGIGDMKSHFTSKSDFMGKGTGLGLAIVKLIVDAHDGVVWIPEQDAESGTTISILMPIT